MKVGLQGFWIGDYTENTKGNINFSGGKKVAKAVQLTENRTVSEASIYADDAKDDSAYAVTDVSVGITPNGFSLSELQNLVGAEEIEVTLGGEKKKVTAKGFSDEGKRKGLGAWVTERISGVSKFKAIIYPNVIFRPSDSTENNTKGESISFATETYTGKAFTDLNGKYVYEIEFDTQEEAENFLNKVFGSSESDKNNDNS